MDKIKIVKKNSNGSIDNSESLFDSLDAYSGDHATKILEISPVVAGSTVNYVKIRFGVNKSEGKFDMKPVKDGDYRVESEFYKGFKYYLETTSGSRYFPDKHGVYSITDVLTSPMEIVLHCVVEKFTVTDLNQKTFMEDGELFFWSK